MLLYPIKFYLGYKLALIFTETKAKRKTLISCFIVSIRPKYPKF